MPAMTASQKVTPSKEVLSSQRLLLIIDGTSASERAVHYVANVLGGRRGFRVMLAALLPVLPAHLLEFGGAENPVAEAALENELKQEQHRFNQAGKTASSRNTCADAGRTPQVRGRLRVCNDSFF